MPTADDERTRNALRCLYGAAAATLRDDTAAVSTLIEELIDDDGLGLALTAAALCIGEQLRDVADARHLPPARLLRVLRGAHDELNAPTPAWPARLCSLLLGGAETYLAHPGGPLWDADALCQLAACPALTLQQAIRAVTAAVTWRASDDGDDVTARIDRVCLGLAARTAASGLAR